MPIDNVLDITPRVQYVAAVSQTAFAYPFPIFEDADLVVIVDGVTKTLTTDYTVSGAGDDTGGTVTFLSGQAAGAIVTIYRDIAIERTSDFQANGPLSSATFNDELDRLTLVQQQLESKVDRAVYMSQDDEGSAGDQVLPSKASRANKFFAFDANGNPIASAAVSDGDALLRAELAAGASSLVKSTGIKYDITLAETAVGVTPVNFYYPELDPRRYSASLDATAIDSATAVAVAIGGFVGVNLQGLTYSRASTTSIPNNVTLFNGKIIYTGSTADTAIVQISSTISGALIRSAGAENIRVTTSSTASGLTGFRMENLVRSSWFNNCIAEMNDTTTGTRGHIGFELVADRLVTTAVTGCYQNEVLGATAINCYAGYKLRTKGTGAQQLADPQVNGNRIRGWAYSCVRSAVICEEGALENDIDIRADTFVSQLTLGTTIYVAEILGQYNHVRLQEEIGARADTQYSVRLGADSAFNEIEYHTQNVVTGRVKNDSTSNRNTIRFMRPNLNLGGEIVTVSHYAQTGIVTATNQEVRQKWIAPCPCVVVRMSGVFDANVITSGVAQVHAAKNGVYDGSNLLQFVVGEGVVAKHQDTDPSAGTPINARWVLAKGDVLHLGFTNTSPNTVKGTVTAHIRLASTEVDG